MDLNRFQYHLLVNIEDFKFDKTPTWWQWIEAIIGEEGHHWAYEYVGLTLDKKVHQIFVGFECERHMRMFALYCRFNHYYFVKTYIRNDVTMGDNGILQIPPVLKRVA